MDIQGQEAGRRTVGRDGMRKNRAHENIQDEHGTHRKSIGRTRSAIGGGRTPHKGHTGNMHPASIDSKRISQKGIAGTAPKFGAQSVPLPHISDYPKGNDASLILPSSEIDTRAPMIAHIVRALFRSGIRPTAPIVRRIGQYIQKNESPLSVAERARWYAIAEEKGLGGKSLFPYIDTIAHYSSSDHPPHRRGRRHHQKNRGKTVAYIEAKLRHTLAATEDANHILQLFNHIRKGDRHWMVVPFEIAGLTGTIRIRLDADRCDRMIVETSNGVKADLKLEHGKPAALWMGGESPTIAARIRRRWKNFQNRLAACGLRATHVTLGEEHDGFSVHDDEPAPGALDTTI